MKNGGYPSAARKRIAELRKKYYLCKNRPIMARSLPFHRIKKKLLLNCAEYAWERSPELCCRIDIEETKNFASLCRLLKEEFENHCRYGVLTGEIIDAAKETFAEHGIFHNENSDEGFVLLENDGTDSETEYKIGGTVTAAILGRVRVSMSGRSTGCAYGRSVVRIYEAATLKAFEESEISAFGHTHVIAYDTATVRADSRSFVTARDESRIRAVCYARVEARQNARVSCASKSYVHAADRVTVEAEGDAYVLLANDLSFSLKGKAILRDHTGVLHRADAGMQLLRTPRHTADPEE